MSAPMAALSGEPGIRDAQCISAEFSRRGRGVTLVVTLEVVNPASGAIECGRLWLPVPQPLAPGCRFVRVCEVALSRVPDPGEDLSPDRVFVGRRFVVEVAYRATAQARGRGRRDPSLRSQRKDEADYLRVVEILSVAERGG